MVAPIPAEQKGLAWMNTTAPTDPRDIGLCQQNPLPPETSNRLKFDLV